MNVPLIAEGEVTAASADYIDLKINQELFNFEVDENEQLYFSDDFRKYPVWESTVIRLFIRTAKLSYIIQATG